MIGNSVVHGIVRNMKLLNVQQVLLVNRGVQYPFSSYRTTCWGGGKHSGVSIFSAKMASCVAKIHPF